MAALILSSICWMLYDGYYYGCEYFLLRRSKMEMYSGPFIAGIARLERLGFIFVRMSFGFLSLLFYCDFLIYVSLGMILWILFHDLFQHDWNYSLIFLRNYLDQNTQSFLLLSLGKILIQIHVFLHFKTALNILIIWFLAFLVHDRHLFPKNQCNFILVFLPKIFRFSALI